MARDGALKIPDVFFKKKRKIYTIYIWALLGAFFKAKQDPKSKRSQID